MPATTAEQQRLSERDSGDADWDLWGPYLSYRSWGTVREDYSADGSAWSHFPHDHARSRAYRWTEDGLAGISDIQQYLCFSVALWNGRDPILKERLFGLTGKEGNHAEDVKEVYAHLDATPSHSRLQFLYRYPIAEFPYGELVEENLRRGAHEWEYELEDTSAFDAGYLDAVVTYAKAAPDDIAIQVEITNRSSETATCHVLPTLWFRNTWSWGYPAGPMGNVAVKPSMHLGSNGEVIADHPLLGRYHLYNETSDRVVFTNNESNNEALWGTDNESPYVKDAFHRLVIDGEESAVNPAASGTKAASLHELNVGAGETQVVRLRLSAEPRHNPFADHANILSERHRDADEFYAAIQPDSLNSEDRAIQRAAYAGMIWTKQLYYFDIEQWLDGDPAGIKPPESRRWGRNRDWRHLNNFDVISMPDAWEYPWYAAWDLAFHCIPLAHLDPTFAKEQIELLTREWYMHPNGQLPAYEWELGDVNPPVHAWGARRVYEIDAAIAGTPDVSYLKRVFHKLSAQLHLVGEPQGHRRQQRLPGWLPRPGQHQCLQPVRGPSRWRAPRPVRRHRLDGVLYPGDAGHLAGARQPRRLLRGPGHQVLRALPVDRHSDERDRPLPMGTERRLLLRRAATTGWSINPVEFALDGGVDTGTRCHGHQSGNDRPHARVRQTDELVSGATSPPERERSQHRGHGKRQQTSGLDPHPGPVAPGAALHAR